MRKKKKKNRAQGVFFSRIFGARCRTLLRLLKKQHNNAALPLLEPKRNTRGRMEEEKKKEQIVGPQIENGR
jgi:hypothetical protein